MDTSVAGPSLKIVCCATPRHEGHIVSFTSFFGRDDRFSMEFGIINYEYSPFPQSPR